ncbi:MAG: RtcB family protein [Bacteroidetes bacterium]|nr:RtcB family protein [Rhodothermia bacterium]MCS7155500.1 RtcB family protein [Bacteroidota bacterium]MCX7907407.1 RtcB family protein [Bacteroidota bacterium]
MRVPARLYATERILEQILEDKSLAQLVNMTTLPGVLRHAIAMPDVHQGYGFPVGGVLATDVSEGVVSPGGVGYDINCGVRLLLSDIPRQHVDEARLTRLVERLMRTIPVGTGEGSPITLSKKELDRVALEGAHWAVRQGYGLPEDLERIEDGGRMEGADPEAVSERARERGYVQLGSLGSGNHFLEIQYVAEIFDEAAAQAFGLHRDQMVVLIHCGSRGYGHQICSDYVKTALHAASSKYKIQLVDPELACVPFQSPEGQAYHRAMRCAMNFAWANREVITHFTRQVWRELFGNAAQLRLLYDVVHNTAKIETFELDGRRHRAVVHRKGATRALGPGHPLTPAVYAEVGQPVIIPGSMGTSSWVLVGQQRDDTNFFNSTCHGAGRQLSRHQAKKRVFGSNLDLVAVLAQQGIVARSQSRAGLAEEAPFAYKDVDEVVRVVEQAGMARRVARLRPLGVIKG